MVWDSKKQVQPESGEGLVRAGGSCEAGGEEVAA